MGLKLSALDPKLARRIQDQMAQEDASRTAKQHNTPLVGESELSVPPPVKIQDAKTGRITFGKRIKQSHKPKMNKLETAFANQLSALHPGVNFRPQAWRVELAEGLWFKVDFIGPVEGRWLAYEVKGPKAFRGGFENLKSAARLWPEITWTLVWREKGSGEWRQQHVLP